MRLVRVKFPNSQAAGLNLPRMPAFVPKPPLIEYALTPRVAAAQFARPSMHRLMLNDFYRTTSFRNALITCVQPHMTVLEIGTGSGILAHFARDAGAAQVVAVESTPFAHLARRILGQSPGPPVTVLHASSFDISLPQRADLLVTETLGHLGFDEGILETAYDARQRLLTPEAPILPNQFTLWVAPAESPAFADSVRFWQGTHYGLTLLPVLEATRGMAYLTRLAPADFFAAPAALTTCVLGEPPAFPLQGRCTTRCLRAGSITGLGLSFVAELAGLQLESRSAANWQDVFLPLHAPLTVSQNETLEIWLSLQQPSQNGGVMRCEGTVGVAGDAARESQVDIGPMR